MNGLRPLLACAALFGTLAIPASGQVVTDGSLGPAVDLAGPDFVIGADLGTQTGTNLFHSIDTFNINTGESATFTGPSGLENVVSRVTGGTASNIDGRLASEIPGADFWFVNPAGVVFGQNAWIDVPAGFHMGGAQSVAFSDGSSFSAAAPRPTLSVASPEEFGFLSGNVRLDGSWLFLDTPSSMTLAGQEIGIENDSNVATAGTLQLVSDGHVAVSNSTLATGEGLLISAGGNLILSSSLLDASDVYGGKSAGSLKIAVDGSLTMEWSELRAQTFSIGDSTETDINVGENATLSNSRINAHSYYLEPDGAASSGAITVVVGGALVLGNQSYIASGSYVGAGGPISVHASSIDIQSGSGFSSTSESSEPGGNIDVVVDWIRLMDGSAIVALNGGSGNAGNPQAALCARNALVYGADDLWRPSQIAAGEPCRTTVHPGA